MTTDAIPLITVEKNQGNEEAQFVLNPKAISMIKKLPSPVKVISAIGDARVGKSTALNFIHNKLNHPDTSVSDTKHVEQVFETGNTMQPVTHGVWIAKPSGNDNTILLDVEGTDLGDDTVTNKLSIFTALTSSTLMLFMKEAPSTHILDFLYKIVRLCKLAFGKKESDNFPRLTVVLREALEAPEEYKDIDHYIIAALITPTWNDGSDEKRRDIKTRFPKEHITVFNLPYDANVRKNPKSSKKVAGSEYLEGIKELLEHISQSPEKKSLEGALLDGQNLADLAEKIVKVMNDKKLWEELNPDFYSLFEEELCRKGYDKCIEPFISSKHTAQEMEDQKEEALNRFKRFCKLDKCICEAEQKIEEAIKSQKDLELQRGWKATGIRIAKQIVNGVIGAILYRGWQYLFP